MSLPQNEFALVATPSTLLEPDSFERATLTVDYERGGAAVSDSSQGLNVDNWKCWLVGNEIRVARMTDLGNYTVIATVAGVLELALSFDQNMYPVVAYMTSASCFLYWYDSTVGHPVTSEFAGCISPLLTLDDKRDSQTAASDVMLFYARAGFAYYRMQRERYATEHAVAPAQPVIRLAVVGMSAINRLQLHIQTALQQKLAGAISAAATAVAALNAPKIASLAAAAVSSATASGTIPTAFPSNLAILLHADGADGSTTITNSATGGFTCTISGATNTAALSTAQKKFGSSSIGLPGGGSSSVACADPQGTRTYYNLVAEGFFYALDTSAQRSTLLNLGPDVAFPSQGNLLIQRINNQLCIQQGSNVVFMPTSTPNFVEQTWVHVHVNLQGGVARVFLDGVLQLTHPMVGQNILEFGSLTIGRGAGVLNWHGFADEFRFKIEAGPTADFTPPTAPYAP